MSFAFMKVIAKKIKKKTLALPPENAMSDRALKKDKIFGNNPVVGPMDPFTGF